MQQQSTNNNLYHPQILERAQDTRRYLRNADAQYVVKAYNALCGDKFELYFSMDDVFADVTFFGYGCVVSRASTAILADMMEGKSRKTIKAVIRSLLEALHGQGKTADIDPALQPFLAARDYPGRTQCAILAWQEIDRWLVSASGADT